MVTAQKRTENLQDVPISIEVLDNAKLEQLNVVEPRRLRQVSRRASPIRGRGPGRQRPAGHLAHLHARRASGGNDNHSGSQPSVGTYLDEQPVTTIDGTLDVHIYDIQRIEVLEGPRAPCTARAPRPARSASSPTSPTRRKFAAGYDLEGNQIDHGGKGWQARGLRQHPAVADRGDAPGRLGRARCGLHRQRRGHQRAAAASRTACAPSQLGGPARGAGNGSVPGAQPARCRQRSAMRSS